MEQDVVICGIQQIGIGVKNHHEAWGWYKRYFGIDIRVLEEKGKAEFMLPYTGGEPRNRHAAICCNLQGGGGFEIWNHLDFEPRPAPFEIQLGDLGYYAAKIKCVDIDQTYSHFRSSGQTLLGPPVSMNGSRHFFMKDPYGNIFQVVPGDHWYRKENKLTGGGYGAIIGVTDMERSIHFYNSVLGYDSVVYDETGIFEDLAGLPGGNQHFRRVLVRHSKPRQGPFSRLFGKSEMELVQALDRMPRKIFEGRFWGELGFIHLCYDIQGMDAMRDRCKKNGYPFTVDTAEIFKNGSFDMGEAAGIFAYVEDPDGALIEFVETHKIPLIKKLGVSLNLRKRDPAKPLPDFILKSLWLLRAKDIK